MQPELAINDPDTPFSHVAFVWEPDPGVWNCLCMGRTPAEFHERVKHWIGKGVDPAMIKQYACQQVIPVDVVQVEAKPQSVETESLPEWTARVRAEQAKLVQNAARQPVPISCEMWIAISERRPQAYFLLQKYGVVNAIITVGTARTKLEFPTCPQLGHGEHDWSQFDRDVMNPDRPIIVLDGTPENGFKRISLRYPNGQ